MNDLTGTDVTTIGLNLAGSNGLGDGAADTVTTREAEEFFRIDAYVTNNSREQKITRALSAFGNDEELGSAVKLLAEKVRTGRKQ